MTLRGKDYCNCEHAQMLRAAIEEAMDLLGGPSHAFMVLKDALKADEDARLDLWGDEYERTCAACNVKVPDSQVLEGRAFTNPNDPDEWFCGVCE